MKNKKIQVYAQLFFGVALIGVSGAACSQAPLDLPKGTVVVDRTNPDRTIVEFDGTCPTGEMPRILTTLGEGVTENGKTYYFSSQAEHDRFVQNYSANSRY